MRNLRETKQIDVARNISYQKGFWKLLLNSYNKREFFKFEHGEIVEYDLAKFNGEPIKYSEEEQQSFRKLGESNL